MDNPLITYNSSTTDSHVDFNNIKYKTLTKKTYKLRYPEENVNSSHNNLYNKKNTGYFRYPEEVNK
tara:strand:+ start:261 stop:458 length:198 start_codon:yes stop_codon:yes gene_type:complete